MRVWLFLAWFLLNSLIQESISARILVYIPLPFYSHQAAYRPLWKELANRGHHLTLLTLNPMEYHENITQTDLSITYRHLEESNYSNILSSGDQNLKNVLCFFDLMIESLDNELSQPAVRKLVNSSDRFDLVITEFYLIGGAAFSYKFDCPLIGVVSMDGTIDRHITAGNPTHPILYPSVDLAFSGKLSFKQRSISTIFYLVWNVFSNYLRNQQDIIIQKHFGKGTPYLYDLEKNFSLYFINSNPVFHTVRPLGPRTINVGGGLNIEHPKPLPRDIQLFLDESSEGVIYFSLGSSINCSQLPHKTKLVLVETFSQLQYKIVWKYEKMENDSLVLPKNVRALKWLPQQDVLRHPNIKLFITQGGLQSLEEALFIGVPVLVLPFFGDQILNSQKVVEHGFGLSLDHNNLDANEFRTNILELIQSGRYKESAKRLAKQLSDRPMSGVQQAVWWIEYVLRNPNVDILRHPHLDIPLYQYYFLDVILGFLFICVSVIYALKVVFRIIFYIIISVSRSRRKVKNE